MALLHARSSTVGLSASMDHGGAFPLNIDQQWSVSYTSGQLVSLSWAGQSFLYPPNKLHTDRSSENDNSWVADTDGGTVPWRRDQHWYWLNISGQPTSGNPSGKTQRIKRLIPQSRSEGKSVRAGRNLYTEELHQQPNKQAVFRADGSRAWTRRLCCSFNYADPANIFLLSFPPRNQLQAQTLIIPLAKIYHSTFFTAFLKIRKILKEPTRRHSPSKKITLAQDIGLNVTGQLPLFCYLLSRNLQTCPQIVYIRMFEIIKSSNCIENLIACLLTFIRIGNSIFDVAPQPWAVQYNAAADRFLLRFAGKPIAPTAPTEESSNCPFGKFTVGVFHGISKNLKDFYGTYSKTLTIQKKRPLPKIFFSLSYGRTQPQKSPFERGEFSYVSNNKNFSRHSFHTFKNKRPGWSWQVREGKIDWSKGFGGFL